MEPIPRQARTARVLRMTRFFVLRGASLMKDYMLTYLPLFRRDLNETVRYMTDVLKNPQAAARLIDDVEAAVRKRLHMPEAAAPYPSTKRRALPYDPIYVRGYIVFYVVIGDTMEVRRILYSRRNIAEAL